MLHSDVTAHYQCTYDVNRYANETGDPQYSQLPQSLVVVDAWWKIEHAAKACREGYMTMLSMLAAPANGSNVNGSGWYVTRHPHTKLTWESIKTNLDATPS